MPPALKLRAEVLGAVAVRSSALQEDSAHDSYAGQFLTVLNSVGMERLLISVQAVWISGAHGVLVEEMINGEVSGVGFSINASEEV